MNEKEQEDNVEAWQLATLCEHFRWDGQTYYSPNRIMIELVQVTASEDFAQVLHELKKVVVSSTIQEAWTTLSRQSGPHARAAFLALDWVMKGNEGIRPPIREPKSKSVSVGWVLNHLAGGKYPEVGQAYDSIKSAICDYEEDDAKEKALEKATP